MPVEALHRVHPVPDQPGCGRAAGSANIRLTTGIVENTYSERQHVRRDTLLPSFGYTEYPDREHKNHMEHEAPQATR
jgi:hypothetical protein